MRNYLRLFVFTLVLALSSGAIKPFSFRFAQALAACVATGGNPQPPADPADPVESLTSNQTVNCADTDTQGINAPGASGVTVNVLNPDGSISVTDLSAVVLGDDATITVEGPTGEIKTQGDGAVGIEVLEGATIIIEGAVATNGESSAGVLAGSGATVTLNDDGSLTTQGQDADGITVAGTSAVNLTGTSTVSTSGANASGVVLAGDNSALTIGEEATVSTTGSASSAVEVSGTNSTVTVNGAVSSSSGEAAILGTAENAEIVVNGEVTASGSADGNAPAEETAEETTEESPTEENPTEETPTEETPSTSGNTNGTNGIEITSTGATVTIAADGSVKITSPNAAAIIAGRSATVSVNGQVAATGAGSQGVVIGDNSLLTVQDQGVVSTATTESQAVLVESAAESAEITVESGGRVEGGSGQAIADPGETETTVTVNGTVSGSSSAPVIDLGGGKDEVTINGTVRSTGSGTPVALGAGDDTLTQNASQGLEGSGVLASGGDGTDTLNLNNGTDNDSARYTSFESTNVGVNPTSGTGSVLNVTDDQTGNQITVLPNGQMNVRSGGAVDLRPNTTQAGGTTTFAEGSTANVESQNVIGAQPTQTFANTTFEEGTQVRASSGFIRGTATNNPGTGNGEIVLRSDFTTGARTENTASFSAALNAFAENTLISSEQRTALETLISEARNSAEAEAALSQLSGEIQAQAAASGVQAAMLFNNVLLPSGTRTYSRRAPISLRPEKQNRQLPDNPLVDTTPFSNGVWVSGFGGSLDIETNDVSTGFDANTYGIAVGYDRAIGPNGDGSAVFGFGTGYGTTDISGLRDSATVDTFSVGTYIEGARGALSGNAAASYNSQSISGSAGDGDGDVFVASAEGFYNLMPDNKLTAGPLTRVGAAFGSYSGFTTPSSTFGATYESADVSQLMAGLGVRVGGQNQIDIGLLSLNLDLLYESALGDDTVEFTGQFANNQVSVAAPSANSSGFLIGAEADLAFSERASVGVRYQGNLGDDISSHTGELRFSILF
ncbi:MAG: autotransporter domain-containing protein [Cyanobacteria bacterium J06581_3]